MSILRCPTVGIEERFLLVCSGIVGSIDAIEDVVALRTAAEYGEIEIFIGCCKRQAIGEIGYGITDISEVSITDIAALVEVFKRGIARVWVDSREFIASELIHGIALFKVSHSISMES